MNDYLQFVENKLTLHEACGFDAAKREQGQLLDIEQECG